jgi:hypothetical protein
MLAAVLQLIGPASTVESFVLLGQNGLDHVNYCVS